jgi:hypothetical protein
MLVGACRGQDGAGVATPTSTTSPKPSGAATAASAPSTTTEPTSATPTGALAFGFEADKANAPPVGFSFGRTGGGKEGRWLVQAATDAPSAPNVLAQVDADPTDNRFPVAVVESSAFKDVRLSVSCKPLSGAVDQACGLVWRFKDANNHYLVRANALEGNVRLYHVKDGGRAQFASWSGKVATKVWHKLAVEAKGDRFVVTFDGKQILDAKDSTFTDAGKVGVWTKADSIKTGSGRW